MQITDQFSTGSEFQKTKVFSLPVAFESENDYSNSDIINIDAPKIVIPPYNVSIWIEDEDLIEQRRHVELP